MELITWEEIKMMHPSGAEAASKQNIIPFIFSSMFTSSAVVSVWMVLQIFHVIHPGHFTILPVKKNPIAVIGEDVTIPCQLMSVSIPNNTAIEVHWIFSNSSKPIDVIYYHRKNKEEKELKNYGDRAELFYNELNRGNMSLKLRNISLSDQGKYTCVVTTETGFDEIVTELNVTGELLFYYSPIILHSTRKTMVVLQSTSSRL
ncbi:myelin-oligodendrocyte glycoprotein-like [Python bivittatus]|uniref:Myelin-oligodendrocyte glycoprotein-like n=1 Tax=Python bivittatus TaxID=176946 RepID=A0A9F5JFC0_PYTBI|nr:myelin-oligodendrocyte glycoprotein-like [Python bivittatus]